MIGEELIIAAICGTLGAFSKDIFVDNAITLPKKNGEKLLLGSLGGLIIGAIVGTILDGSPLNAFMAGFTGIAILQSLVDKPTLKINEQTKEIEKKTSYSKEEIKELIKEITEKNGIDTTLAIKVAECESALNPKAKRENSPESIDRGLYQINSKWHKEVTDDQAYDPKYATEFFCKAVKEGNLSWWNASKKCWNKENT